VILTEDFPHHLTPLPKRFYRRRTERIALTIGIADASPIGEIFDSRIRTLAISFRPDTIKHVSSHSPALSFLSPS